MGLIEVWYGSGSVVCDFEGFIYFVVVEVLVCKLGFDFFVELLEICVVLGLLIGCLVVVWSMFEDVEVLCVVLEVV